MSKENGPIEVNSSPCISFWFKSFATRCTVRTIRTASATMKNRKYAANWRHGILRFCVWHGDSVCRHSHGFFYGYGIEIQSQSPPALLPWSLASILRVFATTEIKTHSKRWQVIITIELRTTNEILSVDIVITDRIREIREKRDLCRWCRPRSSQSVMS